MLHRSRVEWPCLSIDFLIRERASLDGIGADYKSWFPGEVGGKLPQSGPSVVVSEVTGENGNKIKQVRHKNDTHPMTVYLCAGSQAEKKSDNRLYVMRWSEMYKTLHEDEECSDSEEEN